ELQLGARERLRVRLGFRPPDPEGTLTFLDRRFVVGEKPTVVTTPHQGDLEGNLRSIREARRQADWVLVSIHSHEMRGDDLAPPRAAGAAPHLQPLGRAALLQPGLLPLPNRAAAPPAGGSLRSIRAPSSRGGGCTARRPQPKGSPALSARAAVPADNGASPDV